MGIKLEKEPLPLKADDDGVIRVGGTRVTLDTVIAVFADGGTPEEIVEKYPAVALADAYAVIGFYLNHRAEIEAYLAERSRKADSVRAENEARFPPGGVRERLLARRKK